MDSKPTAVQRFAMANIRRRSARWARKANRKHKVIHKFYMLQNESLIYEVEIFFHLKGSEWIECITAPSGLWRIGPKGSIQKGRGRKTRKGEVCLTSAETPE